MVVLTGYSAHMYIWMGQGFGEFLDLHEKIFFLTKCIQCTYCIYVEVVLCWRLFFFLLSKVYFAFVCPDKQYSVLGIRKLLLPCIRGSALHAAEI